MKLLRVFIVSLVAAGLAAQSSAPNTNAANSGATNADSNQANTEFATSPGFISPIPDCESGPLESVYSPRPDYPLEAAREGIQGQVWLGLVVSAAGVVRGIQVLSGNPMLTNSAVVAVEKWKFKPCTRNGEAVQVSTKLPIDFFFDENAKDIPEAVGGRFYPPHLASPPRAQRH